jgi:hypothetical protein
MFTEPATGTLIGNYRILTFLQPHGPPFDRAALITAAAEQILSPSKALFSVKLCKTHTYIFDRYIVQSV